jgi:hypothetical protein
MFSAVYMNGMSFLEANLGFHLGGVVSHPFFKQYALTLDFDGMRYFMKRKSEH